MLHRGAYLLGIIGGGVFVKSRKHTAYQTGFGAQVTADRVVIIITGKKIYSNYYHKHYNRDYSETVNKPASGYAFSFCGHL